jgi:hypothetical protein
MIRVSFLTHQHQFQEFGCCVSSFLISSVVSSCKFKLTCAIFSVAYRFSLSLLFSTSYGSSLSQVPRVYFPLMSGSIFAKTTPRQLRWAVDKVQGVRGYDSAVDVTCYVSHTTHHTPHTHTQHLIPHTTHPHKSNYDGVF